MHFFFISLKGRCQHQRTYSDIEFNTSAHHVLKCVNISHSRTILCQTDCDFIKKTSEWLLLNATILNQDEWLMLSIMTWSVNYYFWKNTGPICFIKDISWRRKPPYLNVLKSTNSIYIAQLTVSHVQACANEIQYQYVN